MPCISCSNAFWLCRRPLSWNMFLVLGSWIKGWENWALLSKIRIFLTQKGPYFLPLAVQCLLDTSVNYRVTTVSALFQILNYRQENSPLLFCEACIRLIQGYIFIFDSSCWSTCSLPASGKLLLSWLASNRRLGSWCEGMCPCGSV